jgi:hypothetical protein
MYSKGWSLVMFCILRQLSEAATLEARLPETIDFLIGKMPQVQALPAGSTLALWTKNAGRTEGGLMSISRLSLQKEAFSVVRDGYLLCLWLLVDFWQELSWANHLKRKRHQRTLWRKSRVPRMPQLA